MRTTAFRWFAIALIFAAGGVGVEAQTAATGADALQRQVEAIAEAGDIEGRRATIVARLESIGLQPQLEWFDPPQGRANRRGANVVADLPGDGSNVLLLGAHYDEVGGGQGVIDNGAGVAAVLELAERLTRVPLRNYRVRVALFDLEEAGLLGSRAMVRDSARTPLPDKYVNFDVFGYGDTFWAGALDADTPFPTALRKAAVEAGWEIVVDSLYPPSDHLSFRRTSTRSYSVSIVGGDEVRALLPMLRGERPSPSAAPPRTMQIIHTPGDTIDKLDSEAAARAVDVVEEALRLMDSAAAN
jgi:aminopeptidase S